MAKLLHNSFTLAFDYTNFDVQRDRERELNFLNNLRNELRAKNSGDLVGEEVRWPRADGYARYIITREEPLTLAHLDIGDAWRVEPALIRGLRLADVRAMVDHERRLAALFREPRHA